MDKDNHLMLEALQTKFVEDKPITKHIVQTIEKMINHLEQLSTAIHLSRSSEVDQLLSRLRDTSEMLMSERGSGTSEGEEGGMHPSERKYGEEMKARQEAEHRFKEWLNKQRAEGKARNYPQKAPYEVKPHWKNKENEEKDEEGDLMKHMKEKGMISKSSSTDTGKYGHSRQEEEHPKVYNKADAINNFAAERGRNAGGSILKELEDHVRELAGPHATIDKAKEAFEQALKAPHARHFSHTLHSDLLATRGPQVKNRKFKDAGYYPPEGKFDWEYMKRWLQTHILMPYVGGGKYAGTTHYIPR